MPKRTHCDTCKGEMAVYENGVWRCENCSKIWWGPFDKPHAGRKQKGQWCSQCDSNTLQLVATISDVNVFRCSRCGSTLLEKQA